MVIRDFRKNPVTDEELHNCYWYAVVNDLIGGYNVANVNKPESQTNPQNGEFEIGCFMSEGSAKHIAELHNAWWEYEIWSSYVPNIRVALENDAVELTEDAWFDYADEHEAS
jgi:hypothetical protein